MLASEWWELVMGGFVLRAEACVPALVTFDSMELAMSRARVESRQMFEGSWAVCRVCDVLNLLYGNWISVQTFTSRDKAEDTSKPRMDVVLM